MDPIIDPSGLGRVEFYALVRDNGSHAEIHPYFEQATGEKSNRNNMLL